MSILELPSELLCEIFDYSLPEVEPSRALEDMAKAASTPCIVHLTNLTNSCKRFRQVASTNHFWKKACLPLYRAIGLTREEVNDISNHCQWYREQLLLNVTVPNDISRAVYNQPDRVEILSELSSHGKRVRWPIIKLLNSTNDMTITLYCKRLLHTVAVIALIDQLQEIAKSPQNFTPMDLLLTVQSATRSTRNFSHRLKIHDLFNLHPSIIAPECYDCPAIIVDSPIRERAVQIHATGKAIVPDYIEPRMGLISDARALTGLSPMAHGIVLWHLAETYHRVEASLIILPFKTLLRLQSIGRQSEIVYLDYLSESPLLSPIDFERLCADHDYYGSIEPASLEDIANHLLDFHTDYAPEIVHSLVEKAKMKRVHTGSLITDALFKFLSLKVVFGTSKEKGTASDCMAQVITSIWYYEPGLLKYVSALNYGSAGIQWERLESNLCHKEMNSPTNFTAKLSVGSIVLTSKNTVGVIVLCKGGRSTFLTQGWGLASAPTSELRKHGAPQQEYLHFNQDDLAEYFSGYDHGKKAFIPNHDFLAFPSTYPAF